MLVIFVAIFYLLYTKKVEERKEETITVAVYDAVILFIRGDVQVRLSDINRWIDAVPGMTLSGGDSLKTEIDSWAEIGFREDFENVIKVKEKTHVDFIGLYPVKLGLLKGEIRSLVERLEEGSTFEIETPTAICGARGTGWDTRFDGRMVIADTYENEIYFFKLSEKGIIEEFPIIEAGQRCILKGPDEPIIMEDVPPDRIEDWNRWKDDFAKKTISITSNKKKTDNIKKKPKVWVQQLDNGDFQLMISEEEEKQEEKHP